MSMSIPLLPPDHPITIVSPDAPRPMLDSSVRAALPASCWSVCTSMTDDAWERASWHDVVMMALRGTSVATVCMDHMKTQSPSAKKGNPRTAKAEMKAFEALLANVYVVGGKEMVLRDRLDILVPPADAGALIAQLIVADAQHHGAPTARAVGLAHRCPQKALVFLACALAKSPLSDATILGLGLGHHPPHKNNPKDDGVRWREVATGTALAQRWGVLACLLQDDRNESDLSVINSVLLSWYKGVSNQTPQEFASARSALLTGDMSVLPNDIFQSVCSYVAQNRSCTLPEAQGLLDAWVSRMHQNTSSKTTAIRPDDVVDFASWFGPEGVGYALDHPDMPAPAKVSQAQCLLTTATPPIRAAAAARLTDEDIMQGISAHLDKGQWERADDAVDFLRSEESRVRAAHQLLALVHKRAPRLTAIMNASQLKDAVAEPSASSARLKM